MTVLIQTDRASIVIGEPRHHTIVVSRVALPSSSLNVAQSLLRVGTSKDLSVP